MLLLVLILVLVAFGLLVVALLTGNVLSAWLSVAVSVAAAVVLIIDWLQRRSAVKAGRAGADSTSSSRARAPPADLDPVTEMLPVYTPDGDETDHLGEEVRPRRRTASRPSSCPRYNRPALLRDHPALKALPLHRADSSSPRVTSPGSEAGPGEGSGTRPDDTAAAPTAPTAAPTPRRRWWSTSARQVIGGSSAGADAPGGAAGPPPRRRGAHRR